MEKAEIIKKYEKYSGRKIVSEKYFCVKEANSLGAIYNLGAFAYDRGCAGNELLVGEEIGTWQDLMPKTLALLGWADENKRHDLALNWAKEVVLVWQYALETKPSKFDEAIAGRPFTPPMAALTEAGWEVTIWVQKPTGKQPKVHFYLLNLTIGLDGTLVKMDATDNFSVNIV